MKRLLLLASVLAAGVMLAMLIASVLSVLWGPVWP